MFFAGNYVGLQGVTEAIRKISENLLVACIYYVFRGLPRNDRDCVFKQPLLMFVVCSFSSQIEMFVRVCMLFNIDCIYVALRKRKYNPVNKEA